MIYRDARIDDASKESGDVGADDGGWESFEQLDRKGQAALDIYHRDIKPQLDDTADGRYIAVDPDTGEWAMSDGQDAIAILRTRVEARYPLLLQHPRVWVTRFASHRGN